MNSKQNQLNKQGNTEELKKFIKQMILEGWIEIDSFTKLKKGDRIRYLLNDGKYRSGGWITYIHDDYTWLRYLSFNKTVFSLQANVVNKIYILPKNNDDQNDKVKFNKPQVDNDKEVKFGVYIDDILVYNARDTYAMERFKKTKKYEKAKKQGFQFYKT